MHRLRVIKVLLPWRSLSDARRALRILDFANQQYGPVPSLLRSGTRYQRERPGRENWLTWPVIMALPRARRVGDCEDLASWAATFAGGHSDLYRASPKLIHVVARVGALTLDPSRALGMGA